MESIKINNNSNRIISMYESTYGNVSFNQKLDHAYKGVYQILSINNSKIQPILLLHSCAALGGPLEDILPLAYATELFNNFILAHNSAMNSNEEKLNTNSAIISGDLIIILTYKYLSMTNPKYVKRTVQLFNEAAESSIKGHYLSIEESTKSKDRYLEIAELKTANQLGIFMQIGSIQAGANDLEEKLMYEFGKNIGMYLYLKDDHKNAMEFSIDDEKNMFFKSALNALDELKISTESRSSLIEFVNSIQ